MKRVANNKSRRRASLYSYGRIARYALPYWPRLLFIVFLTLVASALAATQPWPLKILVDYALGDQTLPPALASFLGGFGIELGAMHLIAAAAVAGLLFFALNGVVDFALTLTWGSAGQRMLYDLALDVFRQLQRLSLIYHSRSTIGDSLNRVTGDTWCVYQLTSCLLVAPAQHLLTLIAIGGVAWAMQPALAILVVVALPILITAAFFFSRWLKENAREDTVWRSRQMALVQQTLSSIPLVKAFASEARNRAEFAAMTPRALSITRRSVNLNQSLSTISTATNAMVLTAILFVGGLQVLDGTMSLGSLLVFIAYVRGVNLATKGLLTAYVEVRTVEAKIERLLEILESPDNVSDRAEAKSLPVSGAGQKGHLRFENVGFGYLPSRPSLQRINLDIQAGESVAIVGRSGAGKSTLVSLIPRFFDPDSGRVTLDGHDLRDIKLSSLRQNVSLVLQDPFILPMSIADNIAYGRPHAQRAEIIAAAKAANIHGFIEELPQGYDTLVAEGGADLSGGQQQRLSIARAILMDAPVLVLDEPTSALDAETESSVMDALDRLTENRTCLIIAHRLSTIRKADRIVVLEAGEVVEIGTHPELMRANGLYKELQRSQSLAVVRRKPA